MIIRGSKVLLTGASGGLGQAIAEDLTRRGAHVVATARNVAQLDALAQRTGAETKVADLGDRRDLAELITMAAGVDVLVANAGVGGDPPIAEVADDEIDAVIDVNLRSPILMAVNFAQALIAQGRPGQIVLIGSLSGLAPSPNSRMYNATKFGLRGFALGVRQDLEAHGIGVTIVEPGFIRDAGMFASSGIKLPKGTRTKTPQDVVNAVARAIESNPAEIFVAPVELALGAKLATIAPTLSAAVQKRAGAAEITAQR